MSPTETSPTTPLDDPDVDRFLTTEEAAERANVEIDTARRWAREGRVDAVRRGRSYAISERSLMRFLGQDRRAPEGGGVFDPNWGPFTRDPFRNT